MAQKDRVQAECESLTEEKVKAEVWDAAVTGKCGSKSGEQGSGRRQNKNIFMEFPYRPLNESWAE